MKPLLPQWSLFSHPSKQSLMKFYKTLWLASYLSFMGERNRCPTRSLFCPFPAMHGVKWCLNFTLCYPASVKNQPHRYIHSLILVSCFNILIKLGALTLFVALRRYEAVEWLRKMVGVVAARDLPAEPSEEEFRLGLRSGIILCNALNRVQPGAVPKVCFYLCIGMYYNSSNADQCLVI